MVTFTRLGSDDIVKIERSTQVERIADYLVSSGVLFTFDDSFATPILNAVLPGSWTLTEITSADVDQFFAVDNLVLLAYDLPLPGLEEENGTKH